MQTPITQNSKSTVDSLQAAFDDILKDISTSDEIHSPKSPQRQVLEEGEFYVSQGLGQSAKRWLVLFDDHLDIFASFRDRRLVLSIQLSRNVFLFGHENLLKHGIVLDNGTTTYVLKSARIVQLNAFLSILGQTCTPVQAAPKPIRRSSSPSITSNQVTIQRSRSNSVNHLIPTHRVSGRKSQAPVRLVVSNTHVPEHQLPSPTTAPTSSSLPPLTEIIDYPLPPQENKVSHDFPIEEFYGVDESYGTMSSSGSRGSRKLSLMGIAGMFKK